MITCNHIITWALKSGEFSLTYSSKKDTAKGEIREIQSMKGTQPANDGEKPHGKLEEKKCRYLLGAKTSPS